MAPGALIPGWGLVLVAKDSAFVVLVLVAKDSAFVVLVITNIARYDII